MCKRPVSVPNPLYKRDSYASQFGEIVQLSRDLGPQEKFITVPCGKCAECRDTYFNSILQRAICESRSSYMYFVTLTYDDFHIPFIDLDGERILYADYSHIQLMFKRFRNAELLDRDFRYLTVNEFGDSFSRPHFHILLFVGKKSYDDKYTPFGIERLLYDNLKRFYACNVGSRKHPIYECLFTLKSCVTPFGIRTNYYVKYVEPSSDYDYLKSDSDSDFIRTIRYLIGYVQTNNRIDKSLQSYLSCRSYDTLLCERIKRLLSNKVRFSKGFGCGFVDGQRFYLPRICVRSSLNRLLYTNLVQNFPTKFDDFKDLYPDLYLNLLDWIELDKYKGFETLKDCYKKFTADDILMHCIMIRYKPLELSAHLKNYYTSDFQPTISYLFKFLDEYKYSYKKVVTSYVQDCDLYRFLRKGVDNGLSVGVPFLSFTLKSSQGYIPLCKYYRDRVCTLDDIRSLYDSLGVKNFDEWRSLFIEQYSTKKNDVACFNQSNHKKSSEIILHKQKKSLHLRSRTVGSLYCVLFRH